MAAFCNIVQKIDRIAVKSLEKSLIILVSIPQIIFNKNLIAQSILWIEKESNVGQLLEGNVELFSFVKVPGRGVADNEVWRGHRSDVPGHDAQVSGVERRLERAEADLEGEENREDKPGEREDEPGWPRQPARTGNEEATTMRGRDLGKQVAL